MDGLVWDTAKNRQAYSAGTGRTGVLLIHGFTGSPGEMRPLGEYLEDLGYAVEIPILAGHCTSVEDINRTHYSEWLRSGEEAYQSLQRRTDKVVVIGHSMGGLVSIYLANRFPVAGLVCSCAPVYLVNWLAWLTPVIGIFMPVRPDTASRNPDIDLYLGGYRQMPVRAVANFTSLLRKIRREIGQVQAPILIQQARLDMTVRPESAPYLFDHVGSAQKQLKWYERSGHMVTVDVEKQQVWEDIVAFVKQVEGGTGSG